MKRTPYRMSAPWPALVSAYNDLPTGHPTRRAVVAALSELAALGPPQAVYEEHGRQVVARIMLGPAMTRRQIEAGT